ncbi:hypothetical protein SE92_04255 [Bradyrhizobium sp. AT1]|nr:hypothetical protein SE92_04255 [Bradyrhizobium sp. AT1]
MWADWIGWTLLQERHDVFVHEWEIGAGENIADWMSRRLKDTEKVLGLFSPAYIEAIYSKSEYLAAYWADPVGRDGFLVPIVVEPCADLPKLVQPLRRLHLYGLPEHMAAAELVKFLTPPTAPIIKPPFPDASTSTGASSPGEGEQYNG